MALFRRIPEITSEMVECLCDKICKYADDKWELNQEELNDMCMICPLHDYVEELNELQELHEAHKQSLIKYERQEEKRKEKYDLGFNPYQE